MDLKKQISKYLKKTGLKIYELEDAAGLPRATLYRYLNGKRGLLLSTAEAVQKHMAENPPAKLIDSEIERLERRRAELAGKPE